MRVFSAGDFLTLWERGEGLHPIDRALLVLQSAEPDSSYQELAALPLGERDRRLLAIWRCNFGDRLDAYAECSACGERLELSLSSSEFLNAAFGEPSAAVEIDGIEFELRCPNSLDAAACAASSSVEEAVDRLLARCVSARGGMPLTPHRRAAVAEALAARDPAAELLVDLRCPACDNGWQEVFDTTEFLWAAIRTRGRRLLQEVDALARAYGWREKEILSLSPARRGYYLELATA